MKMKLVSGDFAVAKVDVLAVLVTEGALEKQKSVARLDGSLELGGSLAQHAKDVEFKGDLERTLDLPTLGRLGAKRLLVVGLGPRRRLTLARLRRAAAVAGRAASSKESLAVVLPDKLPAADLRYVAEGLALGAYKFTKYLTGSRAPKRTLSNVSLYRYRGRPSAADQRALDLGAQIAAGVCIARDAVNEPPNQLTPAALASLARSIARKGRLKISVLDEKGIRKKGMHLHAAVGQGSANAPRFVHMTYAPRGAKKSIAFVGKGLTFDSGGLSIKPAAGMGDMKNDMGGAASVLGVMAALTALKPKVTVHGIIGAAENMPDGAAYRPADVFGSLDGKTVEIINTDAEGRLVLADALAYARDLKPDFIVDVATLPGACLLALGKSCSAFYTGAEPLAKRFDAAAKAAGEAFWRMPLLEELRSQLDSDVADLKHTGDRYGGSISAALFLREFVGDVPWIHCDIAGPVMADRPKGIYPKGGTGHPVLTFLELIEKS